MLKSTALWTVYTVFSCRLYLRSAANNQTAGLTLPGLCLLPPLSPTGCIHMYFSFPLARLIADFLLISLIHRPEWGVGKWSWYTNIGP